MIESVADIWKCNIMFQPLRITLQNAPDTVIWFSYNQDFFIQNCVTLERCATGFAYELCVWSSSVSNKTTNDALIEIFCSCW